MPDTSNIPADNPADNPADTPLDIHLDPGEMSRLVRLDCSHELAFEWLAHLVACELCRDRLARHFPAESRRILDRFLLLHDTRGPAVEVHPSAYDRIFDRARVQGRREIPGRAIPC